MECIACLTCPIWYPLTFCANLGRFFGKYDEDETYEQVCGDCMTFPCWSCNPDGNFCGTFCKCVCYHIWCFNLEGDCGHNDFVCGRCHCRCCGHQCL